MPKRILIVDDDKELSEEMAAILCDQGYLVEDTSDTVQAEKLINENAYDVYLLDYKMSGLSGVDLLRKIKEKEPGAAVLIISGRPSIDKLLKEEKVSHLVSAIIKKPFDVESLLQKIKTLA